MIHNTPKYYDPRIHLQSKQKSWLGRIVLYVKQLLDKTQTNNTCHIRSHHCQPLVSYVYGDKQLSSLFQIILTLSQSSVFRSSSLITKRKKITRQQEADADTSYCVVEPQIPNFLQKHVLRTPGKTSQNFRMLLQKLKIKIFVTISGFRMKYGFG